VNCDQASDPNSSIQTHIIASFLFGANATPPTKSAKWATAFGGGGRQEIILRIPQIIG
jgi:hypothetical protein